MGKLQKKLALPAQQPELFDSWYIAAGESEKSRSLAIWDIIPWRVLTHSRAGAELANLEGIEFEGVRLDDEREVTVRVSPAILPSKTGGETRVVYPGAREELVERALR